MENTIEEIDDILEEMTGKKISTLRVEHFRCTVKLKRLLRDITTWLFSKSTEMHNYTESCAKYPNHLLDKMQRCLQRWNAARARLYAERIIDVLQEVGA